MPLGHLIALISNAHPVLAPRTRPGEGHARDATLGSGQHCLERPDFIKIHPAP
jgi:hypothetical protein